MHMPQINVHSRLAQASISKHIRGFRRTIAARCSALSLIFLPIILVLATSAASGYAAVWMGSDALEQVAIIHVPGAPSRGWCFDLGAIGPGPSYLLSNASQRKLTVLNDRSETLMPPVGQGAFTGEAGCHQFDFSRMGPEGVLVDNGQIFAGNGNSQVEVFDFWTHQHLFDLDTHGINRADEMTIGDDMLAVTNPDEAIPFLTLFNLRTHQIVKQLFFSGANGVPKATAGLEQPRWFRGKFYLSVPATEHNPGGEVDVIDPQSWRVTSIPTPACTPAGLAIDPQGEAAVGCASGDQVLLNTQTGQIIARVNVSFVDAVAEYHGRFFFASYGGPSQLPQLVMSDGAGHVLARRITTSQSHTVTIDPQNGHIC